MHKLANAVRTHAPRHVTWESDCLFGRRFDRIVRNRRVERLAQESLYSLAGVAAFGTPLRKERQADALARFATDPKKELREFLLRDVLEVALGNTDNHARNTSVLKWADGRVELSPLYDFAPMILDARGIARVSRWEDGADLPDWKRVAEALAPTLDPNATRAENGPQQDWMSARSATPWHLDVTARIEANLESPSVARSRGLARREAVSLAGSTRTRRGA